jgi:hypothetical protein
LHPIPSHQPSAAPPLNHFRSPCAFSARRSTPGKPPNLAAISHPSTPTVTHPREPESSHVRIRQRVSSTPASREHLHTQKTCAALVSQACLASALLQTYHNTPHPAPTPRHLRAPHHRSTTAAIHQSYLRANGASLFDGNLRHDRTPLLRRLASPTLKEALFSVIL